MFDRWIEDGLLDALDDEGIGCICFSPLDQGILTNKYLGDVPADSRAKKIDEKFHWGDKLSKERLDKVEKLNEIAKERGQNMAQLAIAWVLRHPQMTSALIGASKPSQITDAVKALDHLEFSDDELKAINDILNS